MNACNFVKWWNDAWKMNILGETWSCELLRCLARDQHSSHKNEPALIQSFCQTGWATVSFLAWRLCVPFFCWYINLSYPESSGYFDSGRLEDSGNKEIDWSISANIFEIWSDCHASYSLFLAQIHIRATAEGNNSQRPSGEESNEKWEIKNRGRWERKIKLKSWKRRLKVEKKRLFSLESVTTLTGKMIKY